MVKKGSFLRCWFWSPNESGGLGGLALVPITFDCQPGLFILGQAVIIAWFLCNNCCWIWLAGGVHFREELKLCFQFLQLSLPLAPTSLFWPCSGVYDWFSCWFKGCPQTLQSNLQVVQMLRFQFLPRLSLLLAPVTLIPSWSESHTERQSRESPFLRMYNICTSKAYLR